MSQQYDSAELCLATTWGKGALSPQGYPPSQNIATPSQTVNMQCFPIRILVSCLCVCSLGLGLGLMRVPSHPSTPLTLTEPTLHHCVHCV